MHRTNHNSDVSLAPPLPLRDELADLASRLKAHVPKLSVPDQQLLRDIERPDGRVSFRRLERLAEIASRSPDAADREALPATLRGRTRRRERAIAGMSLVAIEQEETVAEGDLNCAQLARILHDTPISRARERECALRQLNVTERLLEALG